MKLNEEEGGLLERMAFSEEYRSYWLGTYIVLFTSYILPCLFFECVCERTGWFEKYRIQPKRRPTSELYVQALNMVALNFTWLPFALFGASPLLRYLLPLEGDIPIGTFVCMIVVSFLIDDGCFYVYHRILHENRTVRTPPPPPSGRVLPLLRSRSN